MPLLPLLLLSAAFVGREGFPPFTGSMTPAYPVQFPEPGTDTLEVQAAEDLSLPGRAGLEELTFGPLEFDPPAPEAHEIAGVTVLHLHDPLLPLVDVQVQLAGGPGNFPRERLAAVSAFPFVLRTGGTRTRTPHAVERQLDELALQLSVSGGGGGNAIPDECAARDARAGDGSSARDSLGTRTRLPRPRGLAGPDAGADPAAG